MTSSIARGGRPLAVALLALSLVLDILAPARFVVAQADPADAWATSLPTSFTYNLPAMVLPPDAYPVAGMVAYQNGEMRTPQAEAAAFATALGVDQGILLEQMRASGWRARYVSEVVLPDALDPASFLVGGWSSVTEHKDAAGAQAGFALLDDSAVFGAEIVPAPQVGDASRLTRVTGIDNIGRTYERLRFTFVSGDLVGSVALFWYAGAPSGPVDAATMAATAEALLARIEQAANGTTLLVASPVAIAR